jgi:2-amino-4-hydroxy-6-hydroxymethyldihydropteridine diphosphokinase
MNSALDKLTVVALGSNLAGAFASSEALLEAAVARLAASGVDILARSSWWRSKAWPDVSEPAYVNGVVLVGWRASPAELLALLRAIERAFGRRPGGSRNTPRTLDLDLIACGRLVTTLAGLVLPHPRASERRFVMGPLAEIAPDWRHPVTGITASALADHASVGRDAEPIR